MDLATKRIFITRDIQFYEKHLPYHYSTPHPSPIFLPINTIPDPDFLYDIPEPFILDNSSSTNSTTNHMSPPSYISSFSSPNDTHTSPSSSFILISTATPPPLPITRQSAITHKPPAWFTNYVAATSISSHWCNIVQFHDLLFSVQVLIAQTSTLTKPTRYLEASQDEGWVTTMKKEAEAL